MSSSLAATIGGADDGSETAFARRTSGGDSKCGSAEAGLAPGIGRGNFPTPTAGADGGSETAFARWTSGGDLKCGSAEAGLAPGIGRWSASAPTVGATGRGGW